MKNVNIEINVCGNAEKSTCTVNPPIQAGSHTCCHSGNGGSQEPGVSGVASVFGRTGVVTAQPGDYTADQITETTTRKFASPDEKAVWNAKQAELISGTTIRTLFGQSLLGNGDISPTPAQMGVAAADHTHTTADITDYTQKTKLLIHSSLEAGAGVTLSYNPANEKTIISAAGGGSGGGSGYIVAERLGATAGQNHAFSISPQNTFNLAAYALKEEAGVANQTYVVDDFGASSKANYDVTDDVIFDGHFTRFSGAVYSLSKDSDFYSAEIKADGLAMDIANTSAGGGIVPVMTSNKMGGYTISANKYRSTVTPSEEPFRAFDGTTEDWFAEGGLPYWLRVDLPTATPAVRFSWHNRIENNLHRVRDFIFQGSNDNGATWKNLVSGTSSATLAQQQSTFNIPAGNIASYKSYRFYISSTDDNGYVGVSRFQIYASASKFVLSSNGKIYGVTGGVLSEIPGEVTAEKINEYGSTSVESLDTSGGELVAPVKIISNSASTFNVKYVGKPQIAISKDLMPLETYSKINASTMTATKSVNGDIRLAVTRNLNEWFVYRGLAWVNIGELTAETSGAEKLISQGMTHDTVNAITSAQWAMLFSDNAGLPDKLAFAMAMTIPDTSSTATIDRLVLNVNDASNWKVQTQAEVEIRWRTDSVTFRTATAGNYKLAYQAP
ncbi:hypothetical protein [Pectobacterium versatile]|uniref:hypothetical protein n=1 Tax=Pectobacterium versatile TaxID=2488639 RepID=UPI0038124035